MLSTLKIIQLPQKRHGNLSTGELCPSNSEKITRVQGSFVKRRCIGPCVMMNNLLYRRSRFAGFAATMWVANHYCGHDKHSAGVIMISKDQCAMASQLIGPFVIKI